MGMEPQFWDSSYKWPISITTLFFSLLFSQLCIHTDLGTSQRWINPDWKLLKCPQASKRYYLWGESVVKMIQKSENKLWGHLGWTNTHNAGISCKVHYTALSPIIFLDNLLPGLPVVSLGLLLLEWHECDASNTHAGMNITVLAAERSTSSSYIASNALEHDFNVVL